MIDDSLRKAKVDRGDIESGVVILTGNTRYGVKTPGRSLIFWLRSLGNLSRLRAGDRLESRRWRLTDPGPFRRRLG